jgi:O-antigen/teichoic acid export membrane protein
MAVDERDNVSLLNSRHRATALVVGVQVVFVVALMLSSVVLGTPLTASGDEQTIYSMWAAILFLALGSFLLRRIFNGWERLTNAALLGGVPGLLKTLGANALITCSFGTVAAVVGYAVASMTGDVFDMVRASAVALLVFYANYPRKKVWKSVVARLESL